MKTTSMSRSKHGKPYNCVWELTLACNLRCKHCGSRAGQARDDELNKDQCLDVVDQLAELGCELITLSGGEPTLRDDWDQIGRAIADKDILVNMVTNGVYKNGCSAENIGKRALDAGLCNLAVSIDGPEAIHDFIRGKGTFSNALNSIECFAEVGLPVSVLTTVNRLNLDLLEDVRRIAIDAGAWQWRLQLAKPMGNMHDNRELIIQPADLLTLLPTLAVLKRAGEIHLAIGDSIGYYGRTDKVLRGRGWRGRKESWQGCQAGMQAIGIEADGSIKGCLSLQAKFDGVDPFVEGNVKTSSLADIWNQPDAFAYNRDFDPDSLTGDCRSCKRSNICRGGAKCVAAAFCGHLGEDPYCYYRLLSKRREAALHKFVPPARTAAAALLISLGSMGCDDPEPTDPTNASDVRVSGDASDLSIDFLNVDVGDIGDEDPVSLLEYGVGPYPSRDVGDDETSAVLDIGSEADTHDVSQHDANDISETDANDGGNPDSASDAVDAPDGPDASDMEADAIDCMVEYASCLEDYGSGPPPEVQEQCCAPCEELPPGACYMDYGDPPPPWCCPSE